MVKINTTIDNKSIKLEKQLENLFIFSLRNRLSSFLKQKVKILEMDLILRKTNKI